MKKEWFYVYVLYSLKDKRLYIGYTKDLYKRLKQHNDGSNTSTAPRRPFVLIFAESFLHCRDAKIREHFYKTGRGREILKKELHNTFIMLEKNPLPADSAG